MKIGAGGAVTPIISFQNVGTYPSARLIQAADGTLWGTASNQDGLFLCNPDCQPSSTGLGKGTVFKLDPTTGIVTTVLGFGGTADGAHPMAPLFQASDGNFWGTTWYGGASNKGTVFKVTPDGSATTVYTFTGGTDGSHPTGGLVEDSDQVLWGSASGVVFKIDIATGTFTRAAAGGPTYRDSSLTRATDGRFWGTRSESGNGSIVRITPTPPSSTTVYSFTGPDGRSPFGSLLRAADGNFWGTTYAGGVQDKGTIFKVDTDGQLTTVHSFAGDDGANPWSGLIQGVDGRLYGAGGGIMFALDPSTEQLEVVADLGGPYSPTGLLVTRDGQIWGTTCWGGSNDMGAVVTIDVLGQVTTVHSFDSTDGRCPSARLMEARDGVLWGTTITEGTLGRGTVFTIDRSTSTRTTRHAFAGADGAQPAGPLFQGTDGSIWGTAELGGSADSGVVFKIDPAGVFAVAHEFGGRGVVGAVPQGGLTQTMDGRLWGTTSQGGAANLGTIFVIEAGVLRSVYSFDGQEAGSQPLASLVRGWDGQLWGTTGDGILFKFDPASEKMTTVYALPGGSDSEPLLTRDGELWGTTGSFVPPSNPAQPGAVFRVDVNGQFSTVRTISGTDGSARVGNLVEAQDGRLYGTAQRGALGGGVVFRLTRPDGDSNGISTPVENGAPNGGDGNADGVLDSAQANVTSLPAPIGGQYVTLATPDGVPLGTITAEATPLAPNPPPDATFPVGYYGFTVEGLAVGGATTVTMYLPPGVVATGYAKYGATPDDPRA